MSYDDDMESPRRPSLIGRFFRKLVLFIVLIAIGVVGTLAWQSYGVQAKQVVAARAPDYGLDWVVPWVDRIPTAAPTPVVATAPAAAPAPAVAPTPAAAAAPVPAHDASAETSRQLEALASDVSALRKSVDQLAAKQNAGQNAGTGTDLKDVQQSIQQLAAKQDDMLQHGLKDVRDSLQQVSAKQEQMAQQQDLAAVRQNVEQLAAKQDQMMAEVTKLQSADQGTPASQDRPRRRR